MRLVTRWGLIGTVGIVGAGIAGILSARPPARAEPEGVSPIARLLEELPTYEDAHYFSLGSDLDTDGRARQLAWARTEAPLAQVTDRLEHDLRARGLPVERHSSPNESWLVASGPTDPWIRTLVVSTGEQGETRIIASLSEKLESVAGHVPLPRDCKRISESGARDQGVRTELSLLHCAGTVADLVGFYDARLGSGHRRAWVEPTIDRKDAHVTWSSDDLHVTLMATQTLDQPPVTIGSVTWQER